MPEVLQQYMNQIEIRSYLSIAVYFAVLAASINGYRILRLKSYLIIALGFVLILQNYICAVIPAVDEQIIKAVESGRGDIPRLPIALYLSMYMPHLGMFLIAVGIWRSAREKHENGT